MLSRQNRFFRLTAFVTLWLVLGTIMPGWALVSPAVAQGAGDLGRARDHVDFAEYEQALGILDPLIASGSLSGVSLRDAYVLKARSHIGLGNNAAADDAFCSALQIDPDWRPDQVVFTQDEIAVFNAAQPGCQQQMAAAAQKSSGGKPWYAKPVTWVVGGVVLIGAIILASGGGDDEPPPPDPIGDPPPPPAGK